jgi:ATP-dependent DNA ligase
MLQCSDLAAAGLVESCLPSPAKAPPPGPDWLHEIKHDGFRILAQRNAAGVRLYTGNGSSKRNLICV